jgi:HAD superfamily hydrolase (TIGR01458 family)
LETVERVSDVEGVLFDIDGVLTVSWEAIPGARDALTAVRRAGLPLRLLTNTTTLPRDAIAAALVAAGFEVEPDEILTTPRATAAYLHTHHPGARCLLINEGDITAELAGITVLAEHEVDAQPDVVVLGGAGPAFSYDQLNRAYRAALEGVPVVAMHRNTTWQTSDGLQLDTGAYVAGLEHAAGVAVTTVGKPSPAMFEAALGAIGVAAAQAVMVGDDLEADVQGAMAAGLRGVLVRTGKHRADPPADEPVQPTATIDSVADLPALLGI